MSQLIQGSLQSVANGSGKGIAHVFLTVDVIIAVDTSGSMNQSDCPGNRRRYDVACEQLIRLQKELPGKVGVISWSCTVSFCPGGIPTFLSGGTDLVGALKFIKPADGTSIKLILISDGEPDYGSEQACLDLAKQFKSKLETIYIGPEDGPGRDFLRRLAEATGGRSVSQSINELGQLSQTMRGLLTT